MKHARFRLVTPLLAMAMLILTVGDSAPAADTDGDGLLDVLDVPRFDINASGSLSLAGLGIQDLDGANQLTNLHTLGMGVNAISSIEANDFEGLGNLRYLYLYNNSITSMESGAFEGLNLRDLNLNGNAFADLNLEGVVFDQLFHLGIDRFDVKSLRLDNALLSISSFDEIVRETTSITELSLVGLNFSDANPSTLEPLLDNEWLDHVKVDQTLFELYADEFTAFDAAESNSVTVILEGDCDQDGLFTVADLSCVRTIIGRDAVLAALHALPGDLDGDGDVALADFLVFSANFGQQTANYAEGNIDLNDGVNFLDFLELAKNFGRRPSEVAFVPEPNGFVTVWIALLVMAEVRRRVTRSYHQP